MKKNLENRQSKNGDGWWRATSSWACENAFSACIIIAAAVIIISCRKRPFLFFSVFHCEFESNVVRCSRSDSSSSCADGSHFVTCHWKKKIWIFLSSCQVHRYKMDVRRLEHSTKDHVRWKAAKSVWNFVGAHVTISCWARFNCHVTWFLANRFWAVKSKSRDLIPTNRQSIVGSRPWAGCICGNGPVDGRHIE